MSVPGGSCPQCGATIGPGVHFCPRCGTGIPWPEGARTTVAAPPGAPPEGGRNVQLDALRQATLGEYEVLAELGHGGMATVYLGHDLALDRKVAIKVLAPALLLMGEGMVERFKREARTAAALSHPHIIPIYAVKESEDVLYFVMKYVRGRALDAAIRDVAPPPPSRTPGTPPQGRAPPRFTSTTTTSTTALPTLRATTSASRPQPR